MLETANIDFIQATIEIFGAMICIVVMVMFLIITGNKKKSAKSLFLLQIVSIISLLVDAAWYLVDGNTSTFGIIVNPLVNYIIFLCSPLQVLLAGFYIHYLLEETGKKVKKVFMNIILVLVIVDLLIPLTNLFYTWMYYFDEQNIYHRLSGWYLFTGISAIGLLLLAVFVVINRKNLSEKTRFTLYLFVLSPFIGIALQSTNLGISFIQLGTAIGTVLVLSSYATQWVKSEKDKSGISNEKRNFWLIEGVFLITILCISAAIISCVVSIRAVAGRSSRENSTAIANMVSETIGGVLSEPVTVSRVMSQSSEIIDGMSNRELKGTLQEKTMLDFMASIKEDYGYQMVFASSEATKAYYTYDGFSRIINLSNDDVWYTEYIDKGARYLLNIDTDKDNEMSVAVFVNMGVYDEDGSFIGICGVGTSIDSLIEILSEYEKKYSLNILLVDEDGLVQVCTDESRIETEVVDTSYFDKVGSEEYLYDSNGVKAVLTKRMDKLGWYLIVEDNNPSKLNVFHIILPSLIVYLIGIILMICFILYYGWHEKNRNSELETNIKLSETDKLTGLLNRLALDRYLQKIDGGEITGDYAVVMIDINGLKSVNDAIGHVAGDEMIKGAADCIVEAFGDTGYAFRTGGDEFMVLSSSEEKDVNSCLRKFDKLTKEWKGKLVNELTASVGVAFSKHNPGMRVEELFKIADKLMYEDKNRYYERTGRERRKR